MDIQDPFDNFQLPLALRRLLPEHEQQTLKGKILEIHVRLKKRDPELENNRSRGYHLWLVFDAIAIRLQHQPNFKQDLVPTYIPDFIEQIRSDLIWYPHNAGDLRPYFLAPCITDWRNAQAGTSILAGQHQLSAVAPTIKELTEENHPTSANRPAVPHHVQPQRREKTASRRNRRYETIDRALREIAEAWPKNHAEVFRFLENRRIPVANRQPFKAAGGWLRGFEQNPHLASVWLSQAWGRLGLPTFARGPKK